MNPSDEIMQRLKRKNAILFYQNSEFLSDFFSLLNTQTERLPKRLPIRPISLPVMP